MDKITSMQVFVKTVELGSFARTAEKMNISPQMVAKHIEYLEYHLNTTLIHRTTRKHTITEIGEYYYQNCKKILYDIQEIESFSKTLHTFPKGHLKISAPITFGYSCVAPFITNFLKKYPEINIELVLSDDYVSIIDDGFDLVIRIGNIQDKRLIQHKLPAYQLIVCASDEYLKRIGTPKTPQELMQHNCLVYKSYTLLKSCEWTFTLHNETLSIPVDGNFSCNYWSAMLDNALNGLGILLGPYSILKPYIQSQKLCPILSNYQAPKHPMHILYSKSGKPTQKVLTFIKEFTHYSNSLNELSSDSSK